MKLRATSYVNISRVWTNATELEHSTMHIVPYAIKTMESSKTAPVKVGKNSYNSKQIYKKKKSIYFFTGVGINKVAMLNVCYDTKYTYRMCVNNTKSTAGMTFSLGNARK